MNNWLIAKIYFPQFFLFKNFSLVKVIYLLIRCCKTRFFLWNTNNNDRNGVNKQNTYTYTPNTQRKITLKRVSMKISDTPPFLNNSTYFTNPSIFLGKIWPPPPFSKKILKSQPCLPICSHKRGRGGGNYDLAFSS